MFALPNPYILHASHLFGALQIVTGWLWLKRCHIPVYISSLAMVWTLILLKGDCLVNQVIKSENKNFQIGFRNEHALFGIPLLVLLASRKLIFNC